MQNTQKSAHPTLFGRLVRCSAHGCSFANYGTTQKAPKPLQDKEDRLRCRTEHERTQSAGMDHYTSANTLSHRFIHISYAYIPYSTHATQDIYMGRVPRPISLSPLLKSFLPLLDYGSHTILMKLLSWKETLQLGTTDRSTDYIISHMCMQAKQQLCTYYMYTTIKLSTCSERFTHIIYREVVTGHTVPVV